MLIVFWKWLLCIVLFDCGRLRGISGDVCVVRHRWSIVFVVFVVLIITFGVCLMMYSWKISFIVSRVDCWSARTTTLRTTNYTILLLYCGNNTYKQSTTYKRENSSFISTRFICSVYVYSILNRPWFLCFFFSVNFRWCWTAVVWFHSCVFASISHLLFKYTESVQSVYTYLHVHHIMVRYVGEEEEEEEMYYKNKICIKK